MPTPKVQKSFQKKRKQELKSQKWWMTTWKHLDTGQQIYKLTAIIMACLKPLKTKGKKKYLYGEKGVLHIIPPLATECKS